MSREDTSITRSISGSARKDGGVSLGKGIHIDPTLGAAGIAGTGVLLAACGQIQNAPNALRSPISPLNSPINPLISILPTPTPRPTDFDFKGYMPIVENNTNAATATSTATSTATMSPTPTETSIPTATETAIPTNTATSTATMSPTPTETSTSTATATATATLSPTPTETSTPTATTISQARASITPFPFPTSPTETATPMPTPDVVKLDKSCVNIGEHAPKTPSEAIAKVGGSFKEWQAVRHVDSKTRLWNGGWDFEAYNAIDTSSVKWDAKLGVHIDIRSQVNGVNNPNYNRPTFDHGVIFDKSKGMTNVNVSLTDVDGWMFARRGGVAPIGKESNISYFVGTKDTTVPLVEQAAYTPFCEACVPNSKVTPTETKAFQNAVSEFTWNKDAQNGTVTVEVYNPISEKMEKVNGAMIAELSKNGIDMSVINELPFGWMINPAEVVSKTGSTTKAEWWTPDIQNGKWTGQWKMEAFPLLSTVQFDPRSGLFHDRNTGKLVTDPSKIYNFKDWPAAKSSWPKNLTVPHADAEFFVRTGGAADSEPNTSWFAGNAPPGLVVSVSKPGIEQAAAIPLCIDSAAVARADALSNVQNKGVEHILWFDQSQNMWTTIK